MAGCGKGRGSSSSRVAHEEMSMDYLEYVDGCVARGFVPRSLAQFRWHLATGSIIDHGGDDDDDDDTGIECFCINDDDDLVLYEDEYFGGEAATDLECSRDSSIDKHVTIKEMNMDYFRTASGPAECLCDSGIDKHVTIEEITPELEGKLSGHLSPSMALQSMDIPNGLANASMDKKVLRDSGINKHVTIKDMNLGYFRTASGSAECLSDSGIIKHVTIEEMNMDYFRTASGPAECLRDSDIDKHVNIKEVNMDYFRTASGLAERLRDSDIDKHVNIKEVPIDTGPAEERLRDSGIDKHNVTIEETNMDYFLRGTSMCTGAGRGTGLLRSSMRPPMELVRGCSPEEGGPGGTGFTADGNMEHFQCQHQTVPAALARLADGM